MKQLAFALLAGLLLLGCHKLTPEEAALAAAKTAAKGYYDHLLAGRYEQFLQGRAGTDSLPDSYREQLITGYRQFMAQQTSAHGGISSLRVNDSAYIDSTLHLIQVFLLLQFADSVEEEIVVPMVEDNGRWLMK